MSNRTLQLDSATHEYLLRVAVHESQPLASLRAITATLPNAGMQISPEQGRFMQWLVQTCGVRRAIEIGVFTGYSALRVAMALPADGRLVACDVNEQTAAIAREHWRRAGVESRIDLRLAPALDTLAQLLVESGPGSFDFAFIDADKANYGRYYDLCLSLLRPGGIIAVDNALWSGRVADDSAQDADTSAIRELTARVFNDSRVSASLIPIGDGLLLATIR